VPERHETDLSSLTFTSAILDSISANIAVLDPTGEILAVNRSWQDFADTNQMADVTLGIGANYLTVCRLAGLDPNARAALRGIRAVMKGQRTYFYHEYPCHSPTEKRWFALRATPLADYPNFVVVAHEDITSRVFMDKTGRKTGPGA